MKKNLARFLSLKIFAVIHALTAASMLSAMVANASDEAGNIIVLTGGRVIDGTPAAPLEDAVVIIEGNLIKKVGSRASTEFPPTAEIIDIAGGTILPGLIDSHTHFTFYRPNPAEFDDDALAALRASDILREALNSGITLVRDVGGRHHVPIALKLAMENEYIQGSRFVVSGQIIGITGSHGSKFELMQPPKLLLESDSPGEWLKHIRQNMKLGADFIMVAPPFTFEEVQLAAQEAHRFGVLIAAEGAGYVVGPPAQTGSYPYPGTRVVEYAVRAQVDVIEHLYPMEEADGIRKLMKEQGTIVVPTISASERHAGERWTNPTETDHQWQVTAADIENQFRKMHSAGVKMAVGTDAIGSHRGQISNFYRRELELFVSWGFSPHQTIQAATRIGAEASGVDQKLGTIESGKIADLIVVAGNPLDDITILTTPKLVMKNGVVIH